jgi:SRSO17 transposase
MAFPRASGWAGELERWLAPFLAALSRPEQRRWAPLYLKGLLLPGERRSVEPLAARVAPGEVRQLHHFVSASPWAAGPLERNWRGRPTGWWAARTRRWWWTTPRW